MTLVRCALLLGLALPLACAGGGQHGPDAGPFGPATVASSATAFGATPMLDVAANGDRVLSWVADAAEGDSVRGRLHVRVDPGDGSPVRTSILSDPLGGIEPHGEAPPRVAAGPSGEIMALYVVAKDVGQRFPQSALRFARSVDGGRRWSVPVSVNEGEAFGSHNFHALRVGDDGSVYASWLSSVRGESGVWLRVSRNGGRTWEASRTIHAAPTCPCCRTALALGPEGVLYTAWRKIFAGDVRDIAVMASPDGGTSWSQPVKPRDDGWVFPGCPHAGPSMQADRKGAVHIAWWTGDAGDAGVWYARSTDHGASWSAHAIDVGERSAPAHVQLALTATDDVIIAWDDGKGSLPGILMRASTDGGVSFGTTMRLSSEGVAASYPVLALHDDSLTVAWTQTADSAYRAALEARPDMKDPAARMALPRVGQQEVWLRSAPLAALRSP